jgi:hypothetical protein
MRAVVVIYSNHVVLRGRATSGPPRQQNKKQPHPPHNKPPHPRPFNSRDRGSLYWSAPVE